MALKRILCSSLIFISSSFCAYADEFIIDQQKLEFMPNEITISVGDTVRFKNSDRTAHHIMSKDERMKVSSPLLPPEKDYVIDFPIAGEFIIGCYIHPKMQLKITVKE